MEEPGLQPLRIISGWTVEWNQFYEIDMSLNTLHYFDSSSLLHLKNLHARRSINLEWSPENDPQGYYYLRVINLSLETNKKGETNSDGDWEHPFLEIKEKSRKKIVAD